MTIKQKPRSSSKKLRCWTQLQDGIDTYAQLVLCTGIGVVELFLRLRSHVGGLGSLQGGYQKGRLESSSPLTEQRSKDLLITLYKCAAIKK